MACSFACARKSIIYYVNIAQNDVRAGRIGRPHKFRPNRACKFGWTNYCDFGNIARMKTARICKHNTASATFAHDDEIFLCDAWLGRGSRELAISPGGGGGGGGNKLNKPGQNLVDYVKILGERGCARYRVLLDASRESGRKEAGTTRDKKRGTTAQ